MKGDTLRSAAALVLKILFLVAGALIFFLLFPFTLRYGTGVYVFFIFFLLVTGVVFRIVVGRKTFRVTMALWLTGSILYTLIALVLILRRVQPLPYISMDPLNMTLYYTSYPLRVLGIFFIGLIFVHITSPVEFLLWGKFGLKIALVYRAFEYSVNAFEETRRALVIQGYWPDMTERRLRMRMLFAALTRSPDLIATTFRNIILWFPWAWICYNSLVKNVTRRRIR